MHFPVFTGLRIGAFHILPRYKVLSINHNSALFLDSLLPLFLKVLVVGKRERLRGTCMCWGEMSGSSLEDLTTIQLLAPPSSSAQLG